MTNGKMAIAIDGPAASGKSSTAKAVARALGFHHVDSGALYRAATAARARIDTDSDRWTEESVLDAARCITLEPTETGFAPLLHGQSAEPEMRSEEVTSRVSRVAKMAGVRDWVNDQVRKAGESFDVVVDGRDIGTVVFPNADLKIFLVADPGERARRRLIERLGRAPVDDEIAEETGKIMQRDEMDAAQSVRAPDSTLIDTTHMTQAEQIARIVSMAEELERSRKEE